MEYTEKFGKYIDVNIGEHIENLRELVRQPSIGVSGFGTQKTAEIIKDWMIQVQFDKVDFYNSDGNPIVFGEILAKDSQSAKTLLIYGAYDSNPVEEDHWEYPPFEGVIIENEKLGTCMVGRGVNNKMKVAGILNAIKTVKEVMGELPVNLLVVFDGEEEIFSPNQAQFIQDNTEWLLRADALYMPFSSQNAQGVARVQLGYKGILYLELKVTGHRWTRGPKDNEIHSMHRPVVDNPAWHLIMALNSMVGEHGNQVLIDGFQDDIAEPSNEFKEMMKTLAGKFDVQGYKAGLGVDNLYSETEEPLDVLRNLFTTAQINIDGIWSGYTGAGPEAVIPHDAIAKIEVRLIPNQTAKQVQDTIETHLQTHGFSYIEVTNLAAVEFCQTSIKEDIAKALIAAYEANKIDHQIWPISIATIPISLYNQSPLNLPFATGCVGNGGNTHGSNEYAVVIGKGAISGLDGYEKLIASVIFEYGK
ncbi:MAG: M20/M25/M40 family metallo-hydrolase [Candidatus Thorarchaeota archaeon]|nr:MAG: M20/M25/M40 family metallo-hydrolase [Candidatus Thorarchaeota archaeon]